MGQNHKTSRYVSQKKKPKRKIHKEIKQQMENATLFAANTLERIFYDYLNFKLGKKT